MTIIHNGIRIKFIDDFVNIKEVLDNTVGTKEIYQFYINKPFYQDEKYKNIRIPIIETKNIIDII